MWDLPGPGLEPVSAALAGGFLTTAPPGKPTSHFLNIILQSTLKKNFFNLFLFLAALGLRCCSRAFSSCGERGLLFVVMHGLLIAAASLVAEHGL